MALRTLTNIGSSGGMVSGDIKPLPQPILTNEIVAFFTENAHDINHRNVFQNYISQVTVTPVPWDNELTHWGIVTPYGVDDLDQHWFR